MLKYFNTIIIRITDGALYGFIGPFSILYIIPRFLMNALNIKAKGGFGIPAFETLGILLMWSGAAIAIWCTLLMLLRGKGTPLVTSAPQNIMDQNIYSVVRHPMMWSILIVTLGEAIMYGQIILFVWLIALSRILNLIVLNYEEPQLERRFGESWSKYCQEVPRWIPHFKMRDKLIYIRSFFEQ